MCDATTIKVGTGNAGAMRKCLLYSSSTCYHYSNSVGKNYNWDLWVRSFFYCRQDSTTFWDSSRFYIHREELAFSRIFKIIWETENAWSFPVSLFLFPRVASCLLRITGSVRSNVKTGANVTWLGYIKLIPSLLCVVGNQISKGCY